MFHLADSSDKPLMSKMTEEAGLFVAIITAWLQVNK